MRIFTMLVALAALLGVVFLFLQDRSATEEEREAPAASEAEEHQIEVAIVMGRIQRFHQKFWLSARAENPELISFYLHEMEEAMSEIADAGVVEDGIDLTPLMRTYGLDMVEHLEQLLEKEGPQQVLSEAGLLVSSCNSCHTASGYDIIKICEPLDASFPDQDFEVKQ